MPSDVWKFFNKTGKVNLTTDSVSCLLCTRKFNQKRGATTNLRNHLTHSHPKEYFKSKYTRSVSDDHDDSTSTSRVTTTTINSKTLGKLKALSYQPSDDEVSLLNKYTNSCFVSTY